MLREYYTTKPQALLLKIGKRLSAQGGIEWSGSADTNLRSLWVTNVTHWLTHNPSKSTAGVIQQ